VSAMSTEISGVGQPGFVARYELADPGREAVPASVLVDQALALLSLPGGQAT